jgi:hypothetical protein
MYEKKNKIPDIRLSQGEVTFAPENKLKPGIL